jgi:hypothetical protein
MTDFAQDLERLDDGALPCTVFADQNRQAVQIESHVRQRSHSADADRGQAVRAHGAGV